MRVASLAFSAFGMLRLDRAPPLSAAYARATVTTTTRLTIPGREL
jgi:hypothetical protein